jgi:hypothetical protein
MSLSMLLEFGGAFDFTGSCKEVRFREIDVLLLAGPASAAVAYK